ncbi:hypothetical protein GCM10023228_22970 [Brevibacillus fulvus]
MSRSRGTVKIKKSGKRNRYLIIICGCLGFSSFSSQQLTQFFFVSSGKIAAAHLPE